MLVDTSVWVDHLRRRNAALVALLEQEQVLTHPFVVGELACGNLAQRAKVIGGLGTLPRVTAASHVEALHFLETHRLMGRGLGWIDVNLLASAALSRVPLWTLDKRFAQVAAELGLGRSD